MRIARTRRDLSRDARAAGAHADGAGRAGLTPTRVRGCARPGRPRASPRRFPGRTCPLPLRNSSSFSAVSDVTNPARKSGTAPGGHVPGKSASRRSTRDQAREKARGKFRIGLRLLQERRQGPSAAGEKPERCDHVERPGCVVQRAVQQKRGETRHHAVAVAPSVRARTGKRPCRTLHPPEARPSPEAPAHAAERNRKTAPFGTRRDLKPGAPGLVEDYAVEPADHSPRRSSPAPRARPACTPEARSAQKAQRHPGTWRGAGRSKAR